MDSCLPTVLQPTSTNSAEIAVKKDLKSTRANVVKLPPTETNLTVVAPFYPKNKVSRSLQR
jgi:hypothetical protein